MKANTGHRYSQEDWDDFFEEVVEAGIPPTGLVALQWWYERTGRKISKSTIQNKVSESSRRNNALRNKKYRRESMAVILSRKIYQFHEERRTQNGNKKDPKNAFHAEEKKSAPERERDVSFHIKGKILRFSIAGTNKEKRFFNMNFTNDELINNWREKGWFDEKTQEIICYLTGKRVPLTETHLWHLDHIQPYSRGGDNSLSNAAPACREANQCKSDLTVKELLELCRSIIAKSPLESLEK